MKFKIKKNLLTLLLSLAIGLLLTACSDDKDKTQKIEKASAEPISHKLLNTSVTSAEKQKFEHEFAKQCEQRELKTSTNPDVDKERIDKACECIATYIMKDLTAIEAEKFLTEHENAQSLRIKYENAAYHCLQQDAHPAGPNFSRK
ncbi:MAG: hypothetical protein HOO92_04775 [Methylococcaceae bacterium]|nr:hypothetical protein [Methylococcaceae bacterium]